MHLSYYGNLHHTWFACKFYGRMSKRYSQIGIMLSMEINKLLLLLPVDYKRKLHNHRMETQEAERFRMAGQLLAWFAAGGLILFLLMP